MTLPACLAAAWAAWATWAAWACNAWRLSRSLLKQEGPPQGGPFLFCELTKIVSNCEKITTNQLLALRF
jgi:hypothetical protein